MDDALARIREDAFGECISCHEELQQKRLEAVPWTRYCITCQEKKEKGSSSVFMRSLGTWTCISAHCRTIVSSLAA